MKMITVNDIYLFLDKIAPFATKCSWDNCGLLIGDGNKQVKKIGFTLDLTLETLNRATEENVDLIITHHPVIFRPQNNFLKGNIAYETAIKGISVISAHTCYDCADDGVSDILAKTIGLTNIKTVETEEEPSCLRIGDINKTTGEDLAKAVADKLDTTVRLAGGGKAIKKVAVCGGSGGDFISDVLKAGADAYVTGDLSHHHFLLAKETGLTIIGAGHYETENISVAPLMKRVSENFPDLICVYLEQENPVKFIR